MLLWLTIALTIGPALVVWLLDFRILRRRDAPDFIEAWWRHRTRTGKIGAAPIGALLVISDRWWIAMPVAVILVWLAAFPARRAIYGESWNVAEYLWSRARMAIGMSGFWIGLLLAPWIVTRIGADNFGFVAAGLMVWLVFHRSLFLWGAEAGPLTDDALLTRFAAIDAKARIRKPSVYAMGSRFFANGMALPSLRPAVLLGRTLLQNLEPDEVAAIYGHEVAHLEHYTSRRFSALSAFGLLLIFAGCASVPFVSQFNRDLAPVVPLAWAVLLMIGFMVRRRLHRRHELESDARGVELCGDVETFIRALTKVYTLARIPRQWDKAMARRATHPSLARRIEALLMRPTTDGRS